MTKLVTSEFKFEHAKQLYNSFEESRDNFYMYAGRYINEGQGINTPIPDTTNQKLQTTYANMLFGKKIETNDVALITRYIPYESGKIFDMYDHDDDLSTKDFYCIVDEDSMYHVYKCLDNNGGSPSTVEPLYEYFTSADNYVFRTDDNYLWKYMGSSSYSEAKKFSTEHFFPIFNDDAVSENAIVGAIDVIKILIPGKYYNNYATGIFQATDLRINGTSTTYKISSKKQNGFFNDCIIYLTSGVGSGQFATISYYYINEFGSFIEIDKAFTVPPLNGTTYEIYPKVNIYSNQTQTVNAVARALINANAANSVYRIEMLSVGENYQFATANVSANAVVGVANNNKAVLKPIYSPIGGHGKNAQRELLCSSVCIFNKFANTEANTIPASNKYNQIGILKDPMFGNTQFHLANNNGSFIFNENIFKINPKKLQENVSVVQYANYVIGVNSEFDKQLSQNEYVLFKGDKELQTQIAKVKTVTNSTHFTTQTPILFTSSNTVLFEANTSSVCTAISSPELNVISVTNIDGIFGSNDQIIGFGSGTIATINTISRSGQTKGFKTFIEAYKYEGTFSRAFTQNEMVYQGEYDTPYASGILYYFVDKGGGSATFYITNITGKFNLALPLLGASSQGVATLASFYEPELVFGSGEVLYIENIDDVTRAKDQSEEFKIIFEF